MTATKGLTYKVLYNFLRKQNANRDFFHDLMPFKVKEILLVATMYDAFSIESEGQFIDRIFGEYHNLNLIHLPRITGVTTAEEVKEELNKRKYDLVIIITGLNKKNPIRISKLIRQINPLLPIFLLLNNNKDIEYYREKLPQNKVDRTFVWNGDSRIFFAMVKLLEDLQNLENDVKIGNGIVKIILLVEDNEKYYSRYLPQLYHLVLEQTRRVLSENSSDELYKLLKLRSRPRILMVTNYEDAIKVLRKYKDDLLTLITDVEFSKDGKKNDKAGFMLAEEFRKANPDLPIIIQSSNEENRIKAEKLKTYFINKNSDTLLHDIRVFMQNYLGFGDFIFRDKNGKRIAVATNFEEFYDMLSVIPKETLFYHASRHHFSQWLMAQGEIELGKLLSEVTVDEFSSMEELREYLIKIIYEYRSRNKRGKLVHFSRRDLKEESNIVSLASGNLGGKGRGILFINTLLYNFDFKSIIGDINIRSPRTAIIGTDEFDNFLKSNDLIEKVYSGKYNFDELQEFFIKAELSEDLMDKLKVVVETITNPIAVRSSSLFEDSLMQPFAGVFRTYIVPNSHFNPEIRLKQLADAIKLVFASIFSDESRNYIEAVNYKIEEEKMAVVLQEVVGSKFDKYYYPHISGVAQSYNFYPISHMKPEDGFAVVALGLGQYVVDGEKAYRFSPKHPNIEIFTKEELLKNSQTYFYAVDLSKGYLNLLEGETAGLTKLDIPEAEKHGTIKHLASVYDYQNDILRPGLGYQGPRILNFANILKYNYIPLAETISTMLDVVKEAMGAPVEIEFAVDLTKDKEGRASFYLLQIKPLFTGDEDFKIDLRKLDKDKIIVFAEKSVGNGRMEDLKDIVFVDVNKFDKTKTEEIAAEIAEYNKVMKEKDLFYVLIGPGRWGTRDKFIGIPVVWSDISRAKVIVETDLEGFPLDASLGSHFFHNVISMNVGYLSVNQQAGKGYIDWDKLYSAEVVHRGNYILHIRYNDGIIVKMDGKKRISVIEEK